MRLRGALLFQHGEKLKKETFLLLLCVCVCLSQAVEQNKDDSHLFTPEERRELSCIEAGKVALSTILTPPPPILAVQP